MHYFTPKRCATSNKIMYHDKAQVQRAADQSLIELSYGCTVANFADAGISRIAIRNPVTGMYR